MTNPTSEEQMKALRHALARANRHQGHIAYVDEPHLNTYQTSVEDYEALVWAGNEYIKAIEECEAAKGILTVEDFDCLIEIILRQEKRIEELENALEHWRGYCRWVIEG